MRPTNLLFILSDQHSREVLGCHGNPLVRTPNLDALAARGVRFTNAYCNCPICVPSRASLATGLYVHENRCWDNAQPYHGQLPSWGHRLIERGHEVASVGKLHYRRAEDANGFTRELMPMHVLDGVGDLLGLLRDPLPRRGKVRTLAARAGRGQSSYTVYDGRVADTAARWLREEAPGLEKPWVLFVGFVLPHYPLIAPPEFFDLYPLEDLPWPRFYAADERPRHPVVEALQRCLNYDDFFDETKVRTALAAYYGMVTYLDRNIGRLLGALDETGLARDTRVIYTSDHGDSLGNRGLWGKFVMYEESVAVPMIAAGPDIPPGVTVETPVSLVDAYPTIVQCVGESMRPEEDHLPGLSLFDVMDNPPEERSALSEYHAVGSITGTFMLRLGRWKYVHYVGFRPQLFDLEADPLEANDLGESSAHAEILSQCEAELRRIVDPEAASALAFEDQKALIEQHGGYDEVRRRGDFGYTPAPGEDPAFL
ncbi:MAG: sulfatase-like hydrolase/transferase [Alphaproteobacteria bacterium]